MGLRTQYLKIVFILLSLTVLTYLVAAESDVRIVFSKIKCQKLNESQVKFLNCSVATTSKFSSVSVGWVFNEDIYMLNLNIEVLLHQNDGRTMKLFQFKMNMCEFLTGAPRRNLLQLIYKQMANSGLNLPKKCPFKKGIFYTNTGLIIDNSFVPVYIPELNFSTTTVWMTNGKNLMKTSSSGVICKGKSMCKAN